jgi:hypothetical protein
MIPRLPRLPLYSHCRLVRKVKILALIDLRIFKDEIIFYSNTTIDIYIFL